MELQDFEGNIHPTQYNENRLKLYKTCGQVFFGLGGGMHLKFHNELN